MPSTEIDRWIHEAKRFWKDNKSQLGKMLGLSVAVAVLVNLIAMLWPIVIIVIATFGPMAAWEYFKWKNSPKGHNRSP